MTPKPHLASGAASQHSVASCLVRSGQIATLVDFRPMKKALLIGINYPSRDPKNHLSSPQEEVKHLSTLLLKHYGYHPDDIIVLTDETTTKLEHQPTRVNMMREIEAFLKVRQAGDQFFFFFAGHSTQKPTNNPEEEDGMDELILPLDAVDEHGATMIDNAIDDNFLKRHLVLPLLNVKAGLLAIFDTCHSGTLLDLPHHRCNRVCSRSSPIRRSLRYSREIEEKVLNHDHSHIELLKKVVKQLSSTTRNTTISTRDEQAISRCSGYSENCLRRHGVRNNIICISACKDNQETFVCKDTPSMTTEFIRLLGEDKQPTLKKVMRTLSSRAACRKEGNPQISSLEPLWMNTPLTI